MKIHGNKAQAGSNAVQRERLTPKKPQGCVIVRPDNESIGGGNNKTSRLATGHKSNSSIDAKISFYGLA